MPAETVKAAFFGPLLRTLVAPAIVAVSVAFWWSSTRAMPEPPPMLDQALLRLTDNTEFNPPDETPEVLPWEHYTVQPGDSVVNLWIDQWQLPKNTLYQLIYDTDQGDLLNHLSPGQHLEWQANSDGDLLTLRLWQPGETQGYQWDWHGDAVTGEPLHQARTVHQVQIAGRVQTSLSVALAQHPALAGSAGSIAAQMAELLPLSRKARKGDRFSVLVDMERLQGNDKVYSAKLMGFDYQGKQIQVTAARFDDGRFYTPDGKSLLPSFWRYPFVNHHFRISSPFDLHRLHPVTGRIAPHYGTDFAMPTGTKVEAPADGVVRRVVHHNRFAGNYIVIDHGDGYSTRYLHLSKIEVHAGEVVHQGEVIALSGNTGRTTGPHLHYELRMNGRPVNAMKVALPTKGKLHPDELKRFRNEYASYFKLPAGSGVNAVAVVQVPHHKTATGG